ncbi:PA0069 family radical SAM protein [Duganella callida]|uniref:PA0069 family radical SAM protein n=1 Tax=Duganella callida TaxID=2561932 RepID=A0A4Y9S1J4_9BURK|nr:PA0069 family radical SAM protein [Duganella callida]TFW13896.1 PA0069 family radical SAM protein [Duganella callida]
MSYDENNQEQVMLPPPSLKAQKGRGAVSNIQGRYEVDTREDYDDGWEREEEEARPLKTQVTEEICRSILSRNASPDLPFSVSLNPYRGCEHGCIYCFARPTHSYLGLSPGMDFESKIFAKVNAPEMLRKELAKPGYVPESIALGVNTDAYQPCERDLRLTRRVLEVLQECQHPVGLITKNALIERDIDILAPMAAKRQAGVAITLTTLDASIARTLEPRATTPARRLRTIRTLTDAGIPVAVSIAPIIPFITEPDIERIMEAVKEAGAVSAHYTVLRLPWEVAPLFKEWLQAHFPERAQRVMNRVREMRGGKDYDSDFATRMKGEGVWAELIRQRVKIAAERLGLAGHGSRFHAMDASQFTRPLVVPPLGALARAAADAGQMDLF